jgi:hypothetical protein
VSAGAPVQGPLHASDPPLKIDSGATTPVDSSTVDTTLSQVQWERLSQQRDVMIRAMVAVFTWLNGGVFGFTVLAWGVGIWDKSYRIVDNSTLLELIGATVVQAGIAFLAITRFLCPGAKADDTN